MRYNGIDIIVEMGLRQSRTRAADHHDAILLGALREDVRRLPVFGIIYEHLSLTHFTGRWLPGGFIPFLWPGPGMMADRFFSKGQAHLTAGRTAAAFIQLGRAAHLLIDMACPVHVHRVIHETDPFEWYVESHSRELKDLPIAPPPAKKKASSLIRSLARFTQTFEPDRTHSLHGRALKRLGLRRPIDNKTLSRQAEAIIPVAAAHLAALVDLFLSE